MAAGVTQLTVLDGTSTSRSMQVYSSNGAISGNLSPLQTIVGADGATPAASANPLPVSSSPYLWTPKGYQQITSATLATSTALTVPGGATFALIQCEAVDVRWRDDGSAPTASVGVLLFGGSQQFFYGDLAALRFIRTAAGSIINVSYYA